MKTKSELGKIGAAASRPIQHALRQKRIDIYNINPKQCKQCFKTFTYDERFKSFCDRSCGALFHNALRIENGYRQKRKPRHSCIQCNNTLPERYQKKFCSMICKMEHSKNIFMCSIENGGKVPQRRLKAYLISIHGNRCLDPECLWDFDKRPIVVEMEHKDGNAENNHLDNLTLLCPNCHSLTPTYKSRNKGNGRAFRRARYKDGKSY